MKTIIFPMFIKSAKGGMQQIVLDLLLGLSKYGYNCIYIGYKDCEVYSYYKMAGITSIGIPCPTKKFDFIKFVRSFHKVIRKYKDALIITNDIYSHILLSLYCGHKKEIFVSHGGDYKSKGKIYAARSGYSAKFARLFSFKRVNRFIAVSDTQATSLNKNAKVDKQKISIVYNGYDCKKTNIHPPKIEKGETINISIVGYIKRLKNQHILLDAISKLRAEGYDCVLNLFGSVADIEYKKELDSKIEDNGLTKYVRFYGYISNKEEIYSNTDILISCSHHEGFGLSLIEAMAHNIPTIAYKYAAGPATIIDNNRTGILVEENSPICYYSAIKRYLDDKDFYKSVQESANKKFVAEFSLSVMINKYVEIIETII